MSGRWCARPTNPLRCLRDGQESCRFSDRPGRIGFRSPLGPGEGGQSFPPRAFPPGDRYPLPAFHRRPATRREICAGPTEPTLIARFIIEISASVNLMVSPACPDGPSNRRFAPPSLRAMIRDRRRGHSRRSCPSKSFNSLTHNQEGPSTRGGPCTRRRKAPGDGKK